MDPDSEQSEQLREQAGPSGAQEQNNGGYRVAGHDCEGSRCLCRRYENGELAAMINQGRNQNDDLYRNVGRNARGIYQNNRPPNNQQVQGHLNPNYQRPIDFVRNNNNRQEPEENIYERLDNDEDNARDNEPDNNDPDPQEDHMYERIDDGPWWRGAANPHNNNYQRPNDDRNVNQYDRPRNQDRACLDRLSWLGRNCFSTENIANASTNSRYVYHLGATCLCPFCRHSDARNFCQYYHNLRDRLRNYDGNYGESLAAASRQYAAYQGARRCSCAFCRGDALYAKFPIAASRLAGEASRNPVGNRMCRSGIISDSNSAIYFGRLERDGVGDSVNNPLYASPTFYIGRIERPQCPAGRSGSPPSNDNSQAEGIPPAPAAPKPPTTSSDSRAIYAVPSTSTGITHEAPTTTVRSIFSSFAPSTSRVTGNQPSTSNNSGPIIPVNRIIGRQHTCDDSCIRNRVGNVAGVCQFLGRSDRSDYHGRVSVHWWFVNKWLPQWGLQNSERNNDANPKDEEPRQRNSSDTEES